jgi:glycosyltransferase involved in cell wall biosynthesis
MLIGIEATRANKLKKTGVEWYAWHVIQELKKLTANDGNSWVLYSNEMLRGGLEALPSNWFEVRAKWPLPYGWTQLRLSWEMWRRPTEVLFLPGSTLPRILPKKSVVTVHDVGFHRFPQLYKKRQVSIHEAAMKDIRRRASRIITVSEYSGREIAEAYGIDPSRIAVIPNGIDHNIYRPIADRASVDERLQRYRLTRPYFIALGRMESKKNLVTLVKAFDLFKARRGVGDPHSLVFVGIPGYGYEEIKSAIAKSPSRSSIHELGYVPEMDLPALLNAAEALVHPSWYEGFGIPPILAMACGCPVISSDAASLPEVIGPDAAIYFPPDQTEALTVAMTRMVSEQGLKEKLRTAGVSRAAKYTWTNTANLTLPVLSAWY